MSLLAAAVETLERQPVEWWVAVPALVVLALVVAVAPIWERTRGWGWTPAGIVGMTVGTIGLFTTAWLLS